MKYEIKLATINDLESIEQIIIDRCKWFEENNIEQWEINDYINCYNLEYFKNQININKLFVAFKNNEIVGVMLLKEIDLDYWKDNKPAYYIHHLATKLGNNGLGKIMIEFAIKEAKKYNKKYLRLDCFYSNKKLNNYYKKLGFKNIGKGRFESYFYNLWELKIILEN